MKTLRRIIPMLGILMGLSGTAVQAHGPGCWGVGIRFGWPGYCGPWYPGYYGPYYYPPPVYVVQPPVYAVPPAPTAPLVYPAPPGVTPSAGIASAPLIGTPVPAGHSSQPRPLEASSPEMAAHFLHNLSDRDERVRLESVTQLGRIHAQRAVDPLAATFQPLSPVIGARGNKGNPLHR